MRDSDDDTFVRADKGVSIHARLGARNNRPTCDCVKLGKFQFTRAWERATQVPSGVTTSNVNFLGF